MRRNRRILHIKPCSKKYEKRNAPESLAAENNCKTMRQRRGERRKPPAGAEGCRKGLQKRISDALTSSQKVERLFKMKSTRLKTKKSGLQRQKAKLHSTILNYTQLTLNYRRKSP
jgi:hypothetical protein